LYRIGGALQIVERAIGADVTLDKRLEQKIQDGISRSQSSKGVSLKSESTWTSVRRYRGVSTPRCYAQHERLWRFASSC